MAPGQSDGSDAICPILLRGINRRDLHEESVLAFALIAYTLHSDHGLFTVRFSSAARLKDRLSFERCDYFEE